MLIEHLMIIKYTTRTQEGWPGVHPTKNQTQETQDVVGLMLSHRLRRWPNIKPTQRAVFARSVFFTVDQGRIAREWMLNLHFHAEVHTRIQGSWYNYSKSDGNFRHVWLHTLTNDDGNFRHVW